MTLSDGLRVRSEPRISDDSTKYTPLLPIGTELRILAGPVNASGYTWYEVTPVSFKGLSGPGSGWVAMASNSGEPWIGLSRCGPVQGADPVVVGGTAIPARAFDALELGTFALAQAIGASGCVDVVPAGASLEARPSVSVTACGRPEWDGKAVRLAPTDAGDVVAEYRVRSSVFVSEVLLTQGATAGPDGRTNRQNVLILASRTSAPFACVHARVSESQTPGDPVWLQTDSVRCVVPVELGADHIVLRSSAGGDDVWFGLKPNGGIAGPVEIGQPATMNITAMFPERGLEFFGVMAYSLGCGR